MRLHMSCHIISIKPLALLVLQIHPAHSDQCFWEKGEREGGQDWHNLLKITQTLLLLLPQAGWPQPRRRGTGARQGKLAVGKASSCTRALSTAGFGVSAPKGDSPSQMILWVAEILKPYVPAARAARSCPSAWISRLQLMGAFIPPGWQLTTSRALTGLLSLWQLKCTQHVLAWPTLHRDTALSHGRCSACLEPTWHGKTQESERSPQQKMSWPVTLLPHQSSADTFSGSSPSH